MSRHVSYSISMPIEMASTIDAYCDKTGISKSKAVVKLLESGMKVSEMSRYTIPAEIRSSI